MKNQELKMKMAVLSYYNLLKMKRVKCSNPKEEDDRIMHIQKILIDVYFQEHGEYPTIEELIKMGRKGLVIDEIVRMSGEGVC